MFFDTKSLMKSLLEGLAVAMACFIVFQNKVTQEEIITVAFTAAAVFAILDTLAPTVGTGARLGAGWGLGQGMLPTEGFSEEENNY